jgi:hypothetical protein
VKVWDNDDARNVTLIKEDMAIPEMDTKGKKEFTGRDREMMPAKGRCR